MSRNIVAKGFVVIAFAMSVAGMAPSAYAQQCSPARAAGNYGFSDSGTVVGVGPRAAAGSITFNASGQLNGQVTASLNGAVTQTTVSGTYTVNANCTGTGSFGEYDQNGNLVLTATVSVVWDDNMHEARFIFTSIVLANGRTLLPRLTVTLGR